MRRIRSMLDRLPLPMIGAIMATIGWTAFLIGYALALALL